MTTWFILRRLLLWTFVCGTCAIPSFLIARDIGHNVPAMFVGVGLFILAYTAVSCLPAVERLKDRPSVRPTLIIGYCLRVAVSVAFPVGLAIDMLPGMVAVRSTELVGLDPQGFVGTLLTTLVQGVQLNIILGIVMSLLYLLLRVESKEADPAELRGFEVVMRDPPPVVHPAAPESRK